MNLAKEYGVKATAALLDISLRTVANWYDNGKLKGYKTEAGRRKIYTYSIISLLEKEGKDASHLKPDVTFTGKEMEVIHRLIYDELAFESKPSSMSDREWKEFLGKLS